MIEKTTGEGSSPFAYLASEQYISLTTFRKSGAAIATPVWFAFDPDDDKKLYIVTEENTGKVKRLRNNSRVMLAPCDRAGKVHGAEIEARGGIVPEADRMRANAILAKRFGFLYRAIAFFSSLRRSTRTWLEITPAV
ncbi:MAG: PPOX class F420-dependent oxidoreductase [Ktedonobacteraceae bacterium]